MRSVGGTIRKSKLGSAWAKSSGFSSFATPAYNSGALTSALIRTCSTAVAAIVK